MMKTKTVKVESLYEDLGEKERLFLRRGIVPTGKTRSHMIQSVAASAVNRGWTREEFHEVMLRRSNKGASKILEKRPETARAYLDHSWDKAIKFVLQNPAVSNREDIRRQIRSMRVAVATLPWPGGTGSIDLAVLLVHLNIAERLGSLIYQASLRRIAKEAGVTKDTVSHAHVRLALFLTPLPRTDSPTSWWRLNITVAQDSKTSQQCAIYCPDQRSAAAHDVWHQQGLAKGCWRTWNALTANEGVISSELAKRLQAKPRTTVNRLKRLERRGMARRAGPEWFRIERKLDHVAVEIGTSGRGSAREQLYRMEQEEYKNHRPDQVRKRGRSKLMVIFEATDKNLALPQRQSVSDCEPNILAAAFSYAQMGFWVLPLHSIRNGRCTCKKSCRTPGKHPIGSLVPHGLKDATREVEVIREWWARCPFANVGIATGMTDDGLYLNVIDVDPRNGGNDTFVDLIAARGLPETATSRTGSGGTHWLLTSTKPLHSSGALGKGIDFKGVGGYIVAPPSKHQSGRFYEWIRPLDKLSPMPDWLLKKLMPEEDLGRAERA
jgi:Pyruvate/2-oxoacid:ferredoxin oxidoreductase delta subunit